MRRLFFLLVASLQLLSLQTSFAAEPVGRLFSTPAEREALDNLREARKNQPVEIEPLIQETYIERKPIELPEAINVQGYVKRNDGKQGTVWVNGEALQERSGNKDVQVGRLPSSSNRIPIRIPANGKRLTLKAGQTYDPATNKTREARTSVQGDVGTIGNASTP
ncbi:MAG: hypothetical protein ACKE5M_06610 [Methylophilaceae bacterium]